MTQIPASRFSRVSAWAALGIAAAAILGPALPAVAAPATSPKVKVLLHSWLVRDPITVAPWAFRVRRANIWVTGNPAEHWGYTILFDPAMILAPVAPGNQVPAFANLKDAFVTYDRDWFKLAVGQMKVPTSAEFLQSAITMDTVERSAFATSALTKDFGFMRDIGALATVGSGFGKVMGGVYNGSGPNTAANADPKTIVGRAELTPLGDVVKLGGSYLVGYKRSTDAKGKTVEGDRSRYGGDAQVKLGPVRLNAEALTGYDNGKSGNPGLGFYSQALWAIVPEQEALVRFEGWNPDMSLAGDKSVQQYTAGIGWNWLVLGQGTKLQFNYLHDFLPKNGQDDRILTNLAVLL